MINVLDRVANQLLAAIYIDKNDASVIRINFDMVLKIFERFDIIVPPKALENTLTKVLEERLVGKLTANNTAKWVISQAILNTALSIAISKEELIKIKLRGDGIETLQRKK